PKGCQLTVQVPTPGAIQQTQEFMADTLLETPRPGETERMMSSRCAALGRAEFATDLGNFTVDRTGSGYETSCFQARSR
ncbi:MAG: hypothetical protein WBQ83_24480, partial [Candidatus Acidiferrales bacterium]